MYQELRSYFYEIAQAQQKIGATQNNNRFFAGSLTQFTQKLKSLNPQEFVLWLEYPERKPTDKLEDRRIIWETAFAIFTNFDYNHRTNNHVIVPIPIKVKKSGSTET